MRFRVLAAIVLFAAVAATAAFTPAVVRAQEHDSYVPTTRYYRATVTAILDEAIDDDPFVPALDRFMQFVTVRFADGPRKGSPADIRYVPASSGGDAAHNLRVGDRVLVVETDILGDTAYYIADRDRSGAVIWLVIAFFALVAAFAGWKGVRSMGGLAFTVAIIIWYVMPRIVAGENPFTTFLIAGFIIALVSIYLGHGFNRRTTVAVIATMATLSASVVMAAWSIRWAKLFGLGSEEAFFLQVGDLASIDLRGLLLGGIIIGILGVLDDITTAQAATVEEIHKADPTLGFAELVRRGLSVGHEHIVSLVNTLALAYVGASFPLLLLFTRTETPLWVTLNSERITEEVVRTLIGSASLVIAVPVTTYLAAWWYLRYPARVRSGGETSDIGGRAHHGHHH